MSKPAIETETYQAQVEYPLLAKVVPSPGNGKILATGTTTIAEANGIFTKEIVTSFRSRLVQAMLLPELQLDQMYKIGADLTVPFVIYNPTRQTVTNIPYSFELGRILPTEDWQKIPLSQLQDIAGFFHPQAQVIENRLRVPMEYVQTHEPYSSRKLDLSSILYFGSHADRAALDAAIGFKRKVAMQDAHGLNGQLGSYFVGGTQLNMLPGTKAIVSDTAYAQAGGSIFPVTHLQSVALDSETGLDHEGNPVSPLGRKDIRWEIQLSPEAQKAVANHGLNQVWIDLNIFRS